MPDSVKRVFTEAFVARDIAEPLASFDADAASDVVEAFMTMRNFDIVGIRSEGRMAGYVRKGMLPGGACGRHLLAFDDTIVLDDNASLLKALTNLHREPFLFIKVLGCVGGIITRFDLQKAPVRMWLFGIVTLIEMRFTELIEQHCSDDNWKQYLSEARLQKAQSLLTERQRRNQALRVFDCLQFSDKGQIIARNEAIRALTIFPSRRQAEEATKHLEQLRNNLAHAQDIVTTDWDTVIKLCEFISQTDRGHRDEQNVHQP
ncbi:Swt1 family HEPN domain-containing protein [soil metagenome]